MLNKFNYIACGGKDASFLKGAGANFSCTLKGVTGNFDVYTQTPLATPYGFASLPDKNYYAVVHFAGSHGQTPFVTSFLGTVSKESPLDVGLGETALFNAYSYTFELKAQEIRVRFNDISCKLMNGDSTNLILLDLLKDMLGLVSFSNNFLSSVYNQHTHNFSDSVTQPPNQQASSYNVQSPLSDDDSYLASGKGFIDSGGGSLRGTNLS